MQRLRWLLEINQRCVYDIATGGTKRNLSVILKISRRSRNDQTCPAMHGRVWIDDNGDIRFQPDIINEWLEIVAVTDDYYRVITVA